MSRYIDADAFLKSVKQKAYPQSGSVNESERKISLFGIMEILTAMPTADVVEVIPCKDCIYSQIYPNGVNGYCNKQKRGIYSTDFCSDAEKIDFRHKLDRLQTGYGERRTDEQGL